MRSQHSFTLIEIIIVVVILGILAAVALPKITENIQKAGAAEAFTFVGTIKNAFSRCVDESSGGLTPSLTDVTNCNNFAKISMSTSGFTVVTPQIIYNNHFVYTMTFGSDGPGFSGFFKRDGQPWLAATGENNMITLRYDYLTGVVSWDCRNMFEKLCK